jgi:hypothetical protein
LVPAQERSSSLRRIIVFRPGQQAISGRLTVVEDRHIVVLTTTTEEKIYFEDMSRIILAGESRRGMGVLYGAIAGGYASSYLLGTDRGQSGGFLRRETYSPLALLIIIAPSILVGSGLGYLVDPGSDGKEEFFDFTGSSNQRRVEEKRLKDLFEGNAGERTIHIAIQGSQVYPSVLTDNAPPGSYPSGDYNSLTDFNILRRFQVTYSFRPEVEVGISVVWFGEPARNAYSFESLPSGASRNVNSTKSLDAVGRYLVGAYKPFHQSLDKRFALVVGAGIGFASIDYSSSGTLYEYSYVNNQYLYSNQNSSVHVTDNPFSGFLFGEFRVKCDDGLTLGIAIDHVFAPSKTAPADPLLGISAQTLNFGNTSFGFTIGLHF